MSASHGNDGATQLNAYGSSRTLGKGLNQKWDTLSTGQVGFEKSVYVPGSTHITI